MRNLVLVFLMFDEKDFSPIFLRGGLGMEGVRSTMLSIFHSYSIFRVMYIGFCQSRLEEGPSQNV